MTAAFLCDQPTCAREAIWFVGREFDSGPVTYRSRGHSSCAVHLSEACLVTLRQGIAEGWHDARLDVRPIGSVQEL